MTLVNYFRRASQKDDLPQVCPSMFHVCTCCCLSGGSAEVFYSVSARWIQQWFRICF